jgi:hypothetical protein
VKTAADQVEDVIERRRRALEYRYATDVHVRRFVLLGEEGNVYGGKPVEVFLGHWDRLTARGVFAEIAQLAHRAACRATLAGDGR